MREERPVAKGELKADKPNNDAANRDPISGATGAHPVGVGVGAASGGVLAGAAIGTVAGPVGTLLGAAVGALAGGLVGKGVAEMVDPTTEDAYWRDNYTSRDYVTSERGYDDYAPAYRYGIDSWNRRQSGVFGDHVTDMETGWAGARGASRLSWDEARHASRDAWDRAATL